MEDDQQEVVAFLCDPVSYPSGTAPLELLVEVIKT